MKFYRTAHGMLINTAAIEVMELVEDWTEDGVVPNGRYNIRMASGYQYSLLVNEGAAIIELLERVHGVL